MLPGALTSVFPGVFPDVFPDVFSDVFPDVPASPVGVMLPAEPLLVGDDLARADGVLRSSWPLLLPREEESLLFEPSLLEPPPPLGLPSGPRPKGSNWPVFLLRPPWPWPLSRPLSLFGSPPDIFAYSLVLFTLLSVFLSLFWIYWESRSEEGWAKLEEEHSTAVRSVGNSLSRLVPRNPDLAREDEVTVVEMGRVYRDEGGGACGRGRAGYMYFLSS